MEPTIFPTQHNPTPLFSFFIAPSQLIFIKFSPCCQLFPTLQPSLLLKYFNFRNSFSPSLHLLLQPCFLFRANNFSDPFCTFLHHVNLKSFQLTPSTSWSIYLDSLSSLLVPTFLKTLADPIRAVMCTCCPLFMEAGAYIVGGFQPSPLDTNPIYAPGWKQCPFPETWNMKSWLFFSFGREPERH